MAGGLSSLALLVLNSCILVGGMNCFLTDAQFLSSNLTMSAGGSTPGVRVTWSTTLPPECVVSLTVNFRTTPNRGLAATNTTTNTSQTEVIQTGLRCGTSYYIRVVVTGKPRYQGVPVEQVLFSSQVRVFIEAIPVPVGVRAEVTIPILFGVRAEVTADNTSIRVSWQWSCQGLLDLVRVDYQPEGDSLMMYTVDNTAATSATLPNLQCNTNYTITVVATAGEHKREGVTFLSLQGPENTSAAVVSPTSVHLTWVAPCHTQQYHIYYRGTCGAYVDEGRLDTNHQEYTFDGLQEGINYSFTVTQTGFSGGRVLSTGPVYARTFTAVPSRAPQSLEAMFVQPTEVSLRWREVPCVQQNGPITGFVVRYYATCGADRDVQWNKSVVTTGDIIDGLTPNTEYVFQVAAVNVNGTGPFSEPITLGVEPGSSCDSGLDEPQSSNIPSLAADTPAISSDVPTQCTTTSAVAGVAVTAVLVFLVVAVVQFAVIWHLRRSIARLKSQTQRSTAVTTKIPIKECSAYGQIDQGGGEREEPHIYENPQ